MLSGQGKFELWKKTGGQKSRWTVTLTWQYKCKISEQLRTEQEVTTTKTLGIST